MSLTTAIEIGEFFGRAEDRYRKAVAEGLGRAVSAGVEEVKADAPVRSGRLRKGIAGPGVTGKGRFDGGTLLVVSSTYVEASYRSEAPYTGIVQKRRGFETAGINRATDRIPGDVIDALAKANIELGFS